MKKIIIILYIPLLWSCKERELLVDLPYSGDKMVVYSVLSPTEVVTVKVSKTYPPTGITTYINGVTDAEVLLYENDKLIEKLKYTDNGIYISPNSFKPKIGSSYQLIINSLTLPSITTSREIIPSAPTIISYNFNENINSSLNKGVPSKKLLVKIKDKNDEDSFYSVTVGAYSQNIKSYLVDFSVDQANSSVFPCDFKYQNSVFMSDDCFKNSVYEFKRGYELNPFFLINNEFVKKDIEKVVAQVRHLSKSYYEFGKTYYEEEDLLRAFVTPNPRFNNIKGGFGIFATYNETLLELQLK